MKTFKHLLTCVVTLLFPLCCAHGADCCAADSRPSCCASNVAPEQFSDKSLFQIDSTWTTDAGKQIKLSARAGQPQVIVMFFASCQFTCPVTVNDAKRIEAALTPEVRAKVGFTLVSFEPELI